MSPRVFQNLKSLTYVDLYSNVCVNRGFAFPEEYQELMEHLKEICSSMQLDGRLGDDYSKIQLNVDCAKTVSMRVISDDKSISMRVLFGTEVIPGEYPFIVALHDDLTQNFFCGGVLITAKHVVTAAHCIHPKSGQKINATDVFVFIGRYNITRKAERGSKTRWVKEIFVHPEWSSIADKYDADIAILELDDNVDFSEQIRPVCVDDYPENTISRDGKVVSCMQA